MASWRLILLLLAAGGLACADDPSAHGPQMPDPGGVGVVGAPGGSGPQPGAGAAGTGGQAATVPAAPSAGGGGIGSPGAAGASVAPGSGPDAGAPATGAGDAGVGDAGQAGDAAAGSGGTASASGGHEPCPATGEPCRILPLGDSITFGIGYSGGYRVELFRKALAESKSITFTGSVSNGPNTVDGAPFPKRNEGHSGWKIAQLEPLIPSPAFEDSPHIVLLMIGTNDVAQNDDLANAPERLDSLIDRLVVNAPDALIVVATIVPLSFGGSAIQTYNAAIPALVDARIAAGEHVLLVDMFTGFPTSELGDGVHPNQQGYERMAGVWYEAIRDFLR